MTSNQYRDFKGKAQSDTFTKIKPERMTFYKRALRKRMSDPFDEVKYGLKIEQNIQIWGPYHIIYMRIAGHNLLECCTLVDVL